MESVALVLWTVIGVALSGVGAVFLVKGADALVRRVRHGR